MLIPFECGDKQMNENASLQTFGIWTSIIDFLVVIDDTDNFHRSGDNIDQANDSNIMMTVATTTTTPPTTKTTPMTKQ